MLKKFVETIREGGKLLSLDCAFSFIKKFSANTAYLSKGYSLKANKIIHYIPKIGDFDYKEFLKVSFEKMRDAHLHYLVLFYFNSL